MTTRTLFAGRSCLALSTVALVFTGATASCSESTSQSVHEHSDGHGGLGGHGSAQADAGAGGGHGPDSDNDNDDPVSNGCLEPRGACGFVECSHELEAGLHVEPCEALTPSTNPPTSGTHYSVWANFAVYEEPISWGFLLHSIEHSGVVLAYNCDRADAAGLSCTELQASLRDFYDSWPDDPLCSASPHRLIVVPDPELNVPFAAVAWGHSLTGSCFDAGEVSDFIDAHYGANYENICNPGVDPTEAYPESCGL